MTATPKPWDEGVMPTDEQMLDWLLACTRAEQLEVVGALNKASQVAHNCFQANHARRLDQWERAQRARINATDLVRTEPEPRAQIAWRFHAPHITDAAIQGLVGQCPNVNLPAADGGTMRAPARVASARRDGDGVAVTLELPPELAEHVRALTTTDSNAYSIGTRL